MVSLVVSAVLSFLTNWAGSYMPLERIAVVINELVSMGFSALLFVALMRMSAGPKPSLRYLVMGGIAGGFVGVGASVGIASVNSNVSATAGGPW